MQKMNYKVLLLFFGRLFQSAFAIITIKVMTHLLPQSEVGNQYLVQSLLLGFVLVLINPVGMFVNRHFHEWKRSGQVFNAIKELNFYFLAVAAFSIPVVLIIRNLSDFGESLQTFHVMVFISVYIYFSTWFQTLASFFNLLDQQKTFVALNVMAQAVGLVLAFSLVTVFGASAIPWLSGLLGGQMLTLLVAYIKFKKGDERIPARKPPQLIFKKATLLFCIPVAIATLFMWFINQGYRLFVESYIGIESLAALGLGLGLSTSFSGAIESIATQYFYPGYYAALPDSDLEQRRKAWEKLWNSLIRVYIPTFFLAISSAYFLVRFLTSEKFYDVFPYIFYGAAIELFRQTANIGYLAAHGEKKTEVTIFPYVIGAIVLALGLVGMNWQGGLRAPQVAILLIVANMSVAIFSLVVARNLAGCRLKWRVLLVSVGLSLPILIPVFFLDVRMPAVHLFIAEIISGSLWSVAIYLLFTNRSLSELANEEK